MNLQLTMKGRSVLIFVVTYNASSHIISTLDRVPRECLLSIEYEILIIDDASNDDTYSKCKAYIKDHPDIHIVVQQNGANLGYGGNQKLGYQYAINHGFSEVVLLHGDGQYAPEYLPQMLTALQEEDYDVVLGSRMMHKWSALKGNMPMYKWVGNQVLTTIQNVLLSTHLAEFHTGYRGYQISLLKMIPFLENSNYFDFDTEILIQAIDKNSRIKEIEIPTFYGDEVSYVNGLKYAWLIIYATIISRIVKIGWVKDSRFTND